MKILQEIAHDDAGLHVKRKKCCIILLREKFLQFDWLRAAVFQLNPKYLHVIITKLLRVVL